MYEHFNYIIYLIIHTYTTSNSQVVSPIWEQITITSGATVRPYLDTGQEIRNSYYNNDFRRVYGLCRTHVKKEMKSDGVKLYPSYWLGKSVYSFGSMDL